MLNIIQIDMHIDIQIFIHTCIQIDMHTCMPTCIHTCMHINIGMFGYLATTRDEAVIMGEFGGLYGNDRHPKQTTKRVIDYTMQVLVDPSKKFGGGYVWALNPESKFEYNPVDKLGDFTYGLVKDNWLQAQQVYLDGLKTLDAMAGLQPFPCISDNE